MDEWRTLRRDANRAARFSLGWVLIVVVTVVAVGVVLWNMSVATSDIKGQGDAEMSKNAAPNRIEQQADFRRRYEGILSTDRKINEAKTFLDQHPGDLVASTNYTGLVQNCHDAVGEYNAKAQSLLASDYRDLDLPLKIDKMDPLTDCKANPANTSMTSEPTR